MTLDAVYEKYPTKASCLARIEKVRWGRRGPRCPHCRSARVGRKKENDLVGRWNCYRCKSSFTVLSGTIFDHTQVDLQKWFHCIDLVVNGFREASSHELGVHLRLNQKTALRMKKEIVGVVDAGGVRRLQRFIGKEKRRYVRRIRRRRIYKRRGKPVIT